MRSMFAESESIAPPAPGAHPGHIVNGWVAAAVALAMLAGSAAASAQTPLPDREGMQTRLAACALCHGKLGEGDMGRRGGVYPRLAGQPADYLYHQLLRFKSEQRTGIPPVVTMQRLLENLTPAYLQAIADHYAASPQQLPPVPAADPALLRRGKAIVESGVPAQRIPACTTCHGANLEGRQPGTPALAGQYGRYLTVQFMHWRIGQRHNPLHKQIADTLTNEDMQAGADYLASLRPANQEPAK